MALLLFCSVVFLFTGNFQAESSTLSPSSFPSTTNSWTSQSTESPQPSSSTIQSSTIPYSTTSLPSITSTEAGEDSQGIDEGDDGKADDLADYLMRKIGELVGGGDEGEAVNATEDENNVTVDPDLKNCSQVASLDRYCEAVPDTVHVYFNYDVTINGLLKSIFDPDVVDTLQTMCEPGNWCLPDDYHEDILQNQDGFYRVSPFCSDAMWTCLQSVVDLRYECGEEPLNFLTDVILLLCNMESVGDLRPECYARTVEALYVAYADSIRSDGSHIQHQADLEKDDCNDYRVQMTRMYLCADDVCGYDQNVLLEKFSAWASVAKKAPGVAMTCNISHECQTDYGEDDDDDYYYYYDDYYSTMSPQEYEEYKEEMEEIEEEIQKELEEAEEEEEMNQQGETGYGSSQDQASYDDGEVNAGGSYYEEQDRPMMFGLITMTTVLILGMVSLVFIGYRRYKRARHATYRKGYSKLTEEESQMLKNEYK